MCVCVYRYHSTVNCGQSLAIASQIQDHNQLTRHGFVAEFTNAMTALNNKQDDIGTEVFFIAVHHHHSSP
jgi:hypothetical protein